MQINRIGQKVVCVWPAHAFKAACYAIQQFPVEKEAYTVSAFADTAGHPLPGIHLAELPGFACACKRVASSSWPLIAFRPADERQTDISALKDLLKPLPATPERVDA